MIVVYAPSAALHCTTNLTLITGFPEQRTKQCNRIGFLSSERKTCNTECSAPYNSEAEKSRFCVEVEMLLTFFAARAERLGEVCAMSSCCRTDPHSHCPPHLDSQPRPHPPPTLLATYWEPPPLPPGQSTSTPLHTNRAVFTLIDTEMVENLEIPVNYLEIKSL